MRPPREIMEMDLSRQPGNPTSELQAHAQELWAIQDPQELANAAINIVKPLVGRGMSQKNYQMFLRNMQGAMRRGLTGVQSYITNYILKGSGMGRDQEGGRRPAFGEGVLRILARSDTAVFNEALRSFGLKIVGRINTDPLRTQVRNEDVAALASTITEDAYTPVELSTPAKIAKKIAEEAGYVVAVIESLSDRDVEREMQARSRQVKGPQYGKDAHPDFQPLDHYDEEGNVFPEQDPVPIER